MKSFSSQSRFFATMSATVLVSVVTACGGGGGGGDAASAGTTALTISGTAAASSAIAGKAVDAKCASGAGSTTSDAAGAYSISIVGGSLPCLVRTTTDSGVTLHSIASGAGASATADITPVSQLVVARVFGRDPAAAYAAFDTAAAASLSAASVQAASSAVVQQLKSSGVDFTGVGDVLTATLTPASGGAGGNAYGQQLVTMDARLASSGTTLPQLTDTVAASTASTATASGVASLPVEVLLQPKSPTCAALRSHTYRYIYPTRGADVPNQFGTVTVDAVAGTTLDNAPGSIPDSLGPANGECRFGDTVVTQAGIAVSRAVDNGQNRLSLSFPEQTIGLAELAGTWNGLGFEIDAGGTAYLADAGTATIAADGTVSAITFCADVKNCAPVNEAMSLRSNPAGGFDLVNTTQNYTDRWFAYRAGGGELMLVGTAGDGSFIIWTRQRASALPTVGTVSSNWNLAFDNQLLANPAFGAVTNRIDSTDAAAGTYLRTQTTIGANDAHPETLTINSPRDGYLFRPAATAPAADGSTVNVREFTALGLRGMGMSVLTLPSLGWYMFSVAQP